MRTAWLLVAALAPASCASGQASRPAADDSARFEFVKSLAGTWVAGPDAKGAPPGTKVTYRVVSGGSAVEEVEFSGTPHEMITLYTLDHGRLTLTHYCAIGNQPRMELQPSSTDSTLVFDLTSLGNGDPAKDMHMHHAEITLTDANHLNSAWTLWDEGRVGDTHGFSLVRAPN